MNKIYFFTSLFLISLISMSYTTMTFDGRRYDTGYNQNGDPIHVLYSGTKIINFEVSNQLATIYGPAMNDIVDAANQWYQATQHIQINPQAPGYNFEYHGPGTNDHKNTISFDDGGLLDPTNRKKIGFCYLYRNYTRDNVFGPANDRRFIILEADISIHKNTTGVLQWTQLSSSTNFDNNCIYWDLETTIMHEMGHALGLGDASPSYPNAASMVMNGLLNGCELHTSLSVDDVTTAKDLYDPGPNGIGILTKDDFAIVYSQRFCRSMEGVIDDINKAVDCSSDDCDCKRKRLSVNNNFGISNTSVEKINIFLENNPSYNNKRTKRLVQAYLENGTEIIEAFQGYKDFEAKLELQAQHIRYKDFYAAVSKFISELAPMIDASFRCETNINDLDLTLNQKHIQLIDNMLTEALALQPYASLKNKINFLKSKEASFLGKNVKEVYLIIMNTNDPTL